MTGWEWVGLIGSGALLASLFVAFFLFAREAWRYNKILKANTAANVEAVAAMKAEKERKRS